MNHPFSRTWFQFHASDLSLRQWITFRLHVWRCQTCRQRLNAELEERSSFEGARAPRRWILAPVAVALGLSIVLLRVTQNTDDLRPKGGSRFDLIVADSPAHALGARCAPGDRLQASVRTERAHFVIVGVDPFGKTRTLFPLDGLQSAPRPEGLFQLPNSWTLDAAVGRERFVAFFSDEPIASEAAQQAAVLGRPSLNGAEAIVRDCSKAVR